MEATRALVDVLGGHPAGALGLDLDREKGLFAWLVLACLLAAPEAKARAGFAALAEGPGLEAHSLAASPETAARCLEGAGLPRPEHAGALVARVARSLRDRPGASLSALLSEAGDLDAAGGALVALAPGLGAATALRFLRGLRGRLPAADDAPLAKPALAAAACLGWIAPETEAEDAAALLARRLRDEDGAPPLADVEAALERLGAASCGARRADRCPLADACPLR